MPSIVIVGAGFSGTIAALNLRRFGPRNLEIILIDPRGFARGLAYATTSDSHLLNVPAGNMGAFAAAPAGFLDWLRTNRELCRAHGVDHLNRDSFVPRRLYGRYLEALLADACRADPSHPLLRLIPDAVNCIREDQSGLTLRLDHGVPIHAHLAVLAPGNFAPAPPPVANPSFYSTDHFVADPWQLGA